LQKFTDLYMKSTDKLRDAFIYCICRGTVRSMFQPIARAEQNNFDCLRLAAALMVLISHSYALTGTHYDPFSDWLGGYDTGGGIGVAIFFVISGFLVSESVSRRSSMDYLASRALRIMPALAVVTCFDVLLIGPLCTTRSLSAYFFDASTLGHFRNLMVFGIGFGLPDVFSSLPYPAVNGSLWTLPLECGLYMMLPAIAVGGGLTRIGAVIAFVASAAAYFAATQHFGVTWSSPGPVVLKGVTAYHALRLAVFFFAGAALWANRETIAFNAGPAIICGIILYAAAGTSTATLAYMTCVPYLVIFAALKTPVLPLRRIGDLSYGAYLFAFPVQQSLIWFYGLGEIGPTRLTLLATPIVMVLAFISWHLVEKPLLRLRKRAGMSDSMLSPASHLSALSIDLPKQRLNQA
jgi:peptidoglycan/LPS O-acetylase OafA/YrhL